MKILYYFLNFQKLLLLAVLTLFFQEGVTYANVYTVNDPADNNGPNQLRTVLIEAGNTPGTHTINIGAGTYYIDLGQIPFGTTSGVDITINGAGIGNTIIDPRGQSRAFVVNPDNNKTNVKVTFNGMTIQNGLSTTPTGGAAVAAAGGVGNVYSFNNCLFNNNNAYPPTGTVGGFGGAIYSVNASLSVANCLFSGNTSSDGNGGAIYFRFELSGNGQLNIANSSFAFNKTFGQGASGAAVFAIVSGFGNTVSTSVTECTFTSNSAAKGAAGAIYWSCNRDGASVNVNYNRFLGNTSSSNGAVFLIRFKFVGDDVVFPTSELINAKNNWWGCNAGAAGCNDFGFSPNVGIFTPHLQLKTTVSAQSICYPGTSSVQVTTGFTSNSANEPIAASDLDAFIGRPVSFLAGGMGNISGTQSTIQATGTATKTFTSNGTPGIANLSAIMDAPSTTASLTVNTPGSWLGTSSSDWHLPANWCGGAIPTAGTNVMIPAGTPYAAVIKSNTPTALANNLTIATGATLRLEEYAGLEIKGNFTNNGTYDANAGAAYTLFSGTSSQTIPGGNYAVLSIAGGANKTLSASATTSLQFIFDGAAKLLLGDNTLTVNGSVENAGSTSYFVTNGTGGLKKNNLGFLGFTFPIGSETSYTPAVLSNSGSPDNFTVRVGEGAYLSYLNDVPQGSPVDNKTVNKTWYVSEDSPGGSNVGLSLYWNLADELPSFSRSNCFISHYINAGWELEAAGPASDGGPYFRSRSGITSFSPFVITNPDSPLPVILARFDAVREGTTALLSWSTTDETNCDRFEVERSANGKNWQNIGNVRSNGESKALIEYKFVDVYPVSSQENLYRLRMVDKDGTFAYSRIRNLKFDGLDNPVVFPNPVSDKLFVRDFTNVSSLHILDMNGKMVHQSGKMENDWIKVNKRSAGLHLVEIKWLDGRMTTQKIVIE